MFSSSCFHSWENARKICFILNYLSCTNFVHSLFLARASWNYYSLTKFVCQFSLYFSLSLILCIFSLYSSSFQIWKTNMVESESERIEATRWFSSIDIKSISILYGLRWVLFVICICNCRTFILMWVCQSQIWICKNSSLKISYRTVVKSNILLRHLKFLWVFCPF